MCRTWLSSSSIGWLIAIALVAGGPAKGEPAAGGATTAESLVSDADAILHSYVDDSGRVDYASLKNHRAALDAWIASLSNLNPETIVAWPGPRRMAFWINAYNLITLQRIVDHYPIRRGGIVSGLRYPENSIRQISGVWDKLTTRIAGRDLTLDHIEHEILRKEFREPRIHAALVCAAKSCPPLRSEAFTADRLDEQLDDQSRRFLAATHRFATDRNAQVVRLSPILKWYGGDFVGVYDLDRKFDRFSSAEGAVLDYASRYANADDAAFIRTQSYRIEFMDYDWSLNEQD